VFSFTQYIRIESKHEVTILGGLNEFVVKFYGPQGSKYMMHLVYENKLIVRSGGDIESLSLEKTTVMTKSKHQPIPAMPTKSHS